MQTWAWRAAIGVERSTEQLIAVLGARGFAPVAKASRASLRFTLHTDGQGGTLLVSHALGGAAIAQALARALGVTAAYAEVELSDNQVLASSREIASDGTPGAEVDQAEAASELCEEWFEGKKYRSEAAGDLAAVFVDLDDGCPAKGTNLEFERVSGSPRVQSLVDAIRAGATWERTTMGGRVAIRIVAASGNQISVLDEAELAAFDHELG